jgi:hypothetical protein
LGLKRRIASSKHGSAKKSTCLVFPRHVWKSNEKQVDVAVMPLDDPSHIALSWKKELQAEDLQTAETACSPDEV